MTITVGTPGVSQETTNVATHDIVLPASFATNDILLLTIACDGAPGITLPTGWNILEEEANGTVHKHLIAWRRVTGDGSEDDDLTWETGAANEQSTTVIHPISGVHTSQNPEVAATSGEGSSTTPDPPSVTASWGSEENLWFLSFTNDSNITVSTFPTNYTTNGANHGSGGAGGTRAATTWRLATTATEDPGTATLSATEQWNVSTIVFRSAPAGQTVSLGLITEIETPLALAVKKTVHLGLITEVESALAITIQQGGAGQTVILGLITETEFPLSLIIKKTIPFGIITETETPLAITLSKLVHLGLVTEFESALGITIDAGGGFDPIFVGTGSYMDQVMAGLISQGFLEGTVADRERARLKAKLGLIGYQNLSMSDLYRIAGEVNRLLGEYA